MANIAIRCMVHQHIAGRSKQSGDEDDDYDYDGTGCYDGKARVFVCLSVPTILSGSNWTATSFSTCFYRARLRRAVCLFYSVLFIPSFAFLFWIGENRWVFFFNLLFVIYYIRPVNHDLKLHFRPFKARTSGSAESKKREKCAPRCSNRSKIEIGRCEKEFIPELSSWIAILPLLVLGWSQMGCRR